MRIDPVDPTELSDQELLAMYRVDRTLHEEASPGDPFREAGNYVAAQRIRHPESHRRVFLLRDGEEIAGVGRAFWTLRDENRHLAKVHIGVLPEHRRRRLGTRLLAAAAGHARDDRRDLIHTWTGDRQVAGEAFCRAVGAKPGLVTHENRLLLADVDRSLLAAWIAGGESLPDYELTFVELPTPEHLLPAAAEIAQVMNTAPRDDLDSEDEMFSPENLASWEQEMLAGGHLGWRLYARHRPTGRLVGLTQIEWLEAEPRVLEQGDTGVLPEHRGHGLAKWLKAAMLEKVFAEIPVAEQVVTGNAYSNDAMLAINRALGFRPAGTWTVWQVETDAVLGYTSRQSARPLE